MTSSATPSFCRPALVNATCSAVVGRGSVFFALVTGAFCSQRQAASRSATSSRKKQASLMRPWPKRKRPCRSP